jgi:S-adenosyl-L-methionine hydrolase (adenosine-forming)
VANRPRITLLTDFGTGDGYVAAMKGVIAALAPDVLIDDATHDIAPGDVHAGAWALAGYWRLYPSGTVHVAVVDPGVGSGRRALAARADHRFFVAPDNGVLTRVLRETNEPSIVAVENERFFRSVVSATFHGRDIFAPVAAYLASGSSHLDLGRAISDPVTLELPEPQRSSDVVRGVIVHIDRFGNLITSIPGSWVGAGAGVWIGDRELTVRRTYADAAAGEALALIGSRGVLEVSVRDGNAAAILAVQCGAEVTVRLARS